MEVKEPDGTVVRRSDTAEQSDETGVYRVHCYFSTAPERNFELFYCELDAESANASIAHSPRAQEYIYVIEAHLLLKQIPPFMSSMPVILWYLILLLTIRILTMARLK